MEVNCRTALSAARINTQVRYALRSGSVGRTPIHGTSYRRARILRLDTRWPGTRMPHDDYTTRSGGKTNTHTLRKLLKQGHKNHIWTGSSVLLFKCHDIKFSQRKEHTKCTFLILCGWLSRRNACEDTYLFLNLLLRNNTTLCSSLFRSDHMPQSLENNIVRIINLSNSV